MSQASQNLSQPKLCPCCGHPVPDDAIANSMPFLQRRIYEMVRDAGVIGLTREAIYERAYVGLQKPDSDTLSVLISQHINKRLEPYGLMISARRVRAGYRLLPIDDMKKPVKPQEVKVRDKVLADHGTTIIELKPQNVIQAADADLKRKVRNVEIGKPTIGSRPESYQPYAFHKKHVRRAITPRELMTLALMDPSPGMESDKHTTRLIYGDSTLLLRAIGMCAP